ncbi:MAG: hypothetical protein IJA82_00575 [Clostridia bacterium]|nr:hypothetical protein [Clostridia bacterium]
MKEMDILEKCAYIKGLAEGLNLDASKPEGKVLNAIIELLSDVCDTVADIDDEVATLGDYVEELDHDLGEVEEYLYDEDCDCDCDEDCDCDCDDDCDCCDDDCDCDCDCDDCGEDFMEAMCPHCAETICFDNELDPDDLICPACGKAFKDKK